jgi:hypothetical protein
LVNAYISDLGGIECVSEVKVGLIRQLAGTNVKSEQLQARMVNGEDVDIAELCALASTSVRLAIRIGLERRPRDVTPSLTEYLRDKQKAAPTLVVEQGATSAADADHQPRVKPEQQQVNAP